MLTTLSETLCTCGVPVGASARGDGRLHPSWRITKTSSFEKSCDKRTWELDGLPPRTVANARLVAGQILADAKHGCVDRIQATLDRERFDREQCEVLLGAMDLANGNTALMLAAKNGHYKCCELLLECGAEAGARNRSYMTAAELAASADIADMITHYRSESALFR